MLVDKPSSIEIPLRAHAELKRDNTHVISVATPKINAYLGIEMEAPPLEIKYDEGSAAEVELIGDKKTVVFRPLKRLEEGKDYKIPAGVTIHEVGHIARDKFLDLAEDSETLTAIYLNEGLSEFINVDDPAGIYNELGLTKPEGSYERLRRVIKKEEIFGKTLSNFLSLDRLFSTKQIYLMAKSPSPAEDAKSFVPYWVGSSLVRFIVEEGGIESLREIMRQVQVNKKFAYEIESFSNVTFHELAREEERVKSLLKKAISDRFGDVNDFERRWREKVLGEELIESTPINDYDEIARLGLYDGMMGMYAEKDPHFDNDILLYGSFATNPKGRYLEVGCGTGRILLPLLQNKHMMTGVDTSSGMLQVAEQKTQEYLKTEQLRLLRHDFAEKPIEEPHSGAFVSQCTLNYVPEASQLQFLQNIAASLETGAPIILDLFYPASVVQPDTVNQWVEHGSFDTNDGTVRLRVKRWIEPDKTERRIREFIYPDGRTVRNETARIYISPEEGKKLLEEAGFKDVAFIRKYDRSIQSPEFANRQKDENNFILVGYKR